MIMKNFKILFFPLILLGILIYSCDKVEPPYLKPGSVDTSEIKSGDTVKNVLLEDYTGHGCVNCPSAAHTAHYLQDSIYHQRLIIIAVHAGYFASTQFFGDLFSYDFNTPAGTAWDNYYQISTTYGNPNGLVDRVEYESKMVLGKDQWGSAIGEQALADFQAKITIENNYNTGSNTLNSNIVTEFQENLTGSYSILACIVQDHFESPQKDEDVDGGTDSTYIHNNVMRGSMNGDWGENLTSDPAEGSSYEKSYSINFHDDWKPEDCRVVAFVFNEETKAVIQVDEEWVKK
jgi:hypothetical protein